MRDISIYEYTGDFLQQLPKGVFLITAEGDKKNIMTIGWGSLGIIWGKPILTVLVRYSRQTYDLLDKSKEFTVNVPIKVDLKKELALCGSKSAREMDKFAETGLTPLKAKTVSAPIIKECELHYECRVVYQQAMEPGLVSSQIKSQYYPQANYHVLYFGEVVAAYINE